MDIKNLLKKNYWVRRIHFFLRHELPVYVLGDKLLVEKLFYKRMGFKLNLESPKFLSEKLQWVKLYDRKEFNTLAADKYRVRTYFSENFGEEYVVPLLKKYDSWKDITFDNLPNEPFIIKANTGSGTWKIVRDKRELNVEDLKRECRLWMNLNHYYVSLEWQYKNIKPCLVVEKLLTDRNGKIPFDYKLHYINGELQFIYCVVDREGDAYRAMFSKDWKLLPFQWVSFGKHQPLRFEVNEPRPKNLDKMIEFGDKIAKNFKHYVRVDYYECEGKLYFSEITMLHGSGTNKFYPPEAEKQYADKLIIE